MCYYYPSIRAIHCGNYNCMPLKVNGQILSKKPPLGVMPNYIFLEKRIEELKRAITEYVNAGLIDVNLLTEWNEELKLRIAELDKMVKRKDINNGDR